MICALLLTILLLCVCCCCWWRKSKVRHVQRLQRRNSIRQSIRSLNSIGAEGTLRRRNMNLSRSNDILSTNGTDYKKMESNGSFDSIEKGTVDSDTGSFENYDTYNSRKQPPTSPTTTATGSLAPQPSFGKGQLAQIKTPKIYSRPRPIVGSTPQYENDVELAFRNEGFRDNSTRHNSVNTVATDGAPVLESLDKNGSDYYGDTSTLPMGARGDNLSFLIELKNKLPEYETLPRPSTNQSSFMGSMEHNNHHHPQSANTDEAHRSSMDSNGYHRPQIRGGGGPMIKTYTPMELNVPSKRPDSYYTAMRAVRDSTMTPASAASGNRPAVPPPTRPAPTIVEQQQRPRTVYEASGDDQPLPTSPTARKSQQYARSKSEAILETNFSDEPLGLPLSEDNRSHSQPLETAM